jgi:hypothetical protein
MLATITQIQICLKSDKIIGQFTWKPQQDVWLSGSLHEDLSRKFDCFRRHKFAMNAIFVQRSIFLCLWQWHIAQQYKENVLSLFDCNNGFANSRQCYLLSTCFYFVALLFNSTLLHRRISKCYEFPEDSGYQYEEHPVLRDTLKWT